MSPVVAVDARIERGRAGGVQQGIVALARALGAGPCGVDARWVTLAGHDGWLRDAVGPGFVTVPVARDASAGAGAARRFVRSLDRLPGGRQVRDALVDLRAATEGPRPSSGAFDGLGVDVVHFPTQRAELVRTPFVYQPWDLQHRHLPGLFGPGERRRREAQYGAYCRAASVVVVPSAWVRDDVVSAYGLSLERVVVVAPWTPPAAPPVAGHPPDALLPAAARDGAPYAVFPAQAWPHKNHTALLGALAALRRDGLDVALVCPGATGAAARGLWRRVVEAGIDDLVSFPGYVGDDELSALVAHARLLAFPSLFEGFGYPVVEAMAAGVPVIAADGPWLDAAAGDAARRVDARDPRALAAAVREIWTDAGARAELVERGRRHAAALGAVDTGAAWRAVYELALDRIAAGARS